VSGEAEAGPVGSAGTPPVAARFRAADTFVIHSRRYFVIAGEIVEGTVRAGMLLSVPLNGSVAMTTPVHAVEFVDDPGRKSQVGLVIACEDDFEVELWQALGIGGEILDLHESEARAPPPAAPARDPWWKFW
jgi:hypothetical protein